MNMAKNSTRLKCTWIGKENRPKLEPRVLIDGPDNYCHARYRVWQKPQITQMPADYAGTSAQICTICG